MARTERWTALPRRRCAVSPSMDRGPDAVQVFGAYAGELLPFGVQAFGRRRPTARGAAHGPRPRPAGDDTRRWLAALIADAFWRLFNRPSAAAPARRRDRGRHAPPARGADRRRVLAPLQPAGRHLAAAPTPRRHRGRARRVGQLAARAALLPAGQSASRARRAVAPALGSALVVRGRQRGRNRRQVRAESSSRWCIRRAPVSTPSSSGPSQEHPAPPSNATGSASARCSLSA